MGSKTTQPKARIKTGTYTGDGNATQAITGVGFQPDAVMILPGADAYTNFIKTDTMGTRAKQLTSSAVWATNVIISLDSDGFTVGNSYSINTNSLEYHYLAFKN